MSIPQGAPDDPAAQQQAAGPPQPAPPPKKRVPTWLIVTLAGVVGLCCLGGALAVVAAQEPQADSDTAPGSPAPGVAAASPESGSEREPEPEPAPEPDPDGRVTGRCDSLLDSDLGLNEEGRYKFVASLEAENTGNIGIEVDVWAEFELIGAEPVRYTERVEVPVGETVTVHVDESITRNQWQRYGDGGWNCDIGIELVSLIGDVEG
jgi:hypothetical protein